jgi:uncharacterized Zn finger protein (UPF0148 family)
MVEYVKCPHFREDCENACRECDDCGAPLYHMGTGCVTCENCNMIEEAREYHVTWHAYVNATSSEEAAKKALKIQRDPESGAVLFEVRNQETMEITEVDLLADTVNEKEDVQNGI